MFLEKHKVLIKFFYQERSKYLKKILRNSFVFFKIEVRYVEILTLKFSFSSKNMGQRRTVFLFSNPFTVNIGDSRSKQNPNGQFVYSPFWFRAKSLKILQKHEMANKKKCTTKRHKTGWNRQNNILILTLFYVWIDF